ncbi:MAG TPA: DUF6279 family lipoprotein [Nitrospiraceae bacterium]|nr:DUF6279 family lipoprotein [Nitrospiraceae bacterium]
MAHAMTHHATQDETRAGRHRRWTWCAAGLLFFLAGCSILSVYRYADWYILWQADHYLNLTSDQRHDLAQRLTPLLARHRHEAIPQYEAFLLQIRQRLERGLTNQDLDWVYATYDRLRTDLFDRVIADGGVVLASVDSRQVRNLESALQKDNARAARLMQAPAPERLKKRANATIDGLEDWLGPLSKDQEAQIREWSLALPDTQQFWATYQQQRQQELLVLLRQPRTPESVARELRALLVFYPDPTAPQAYQDTVHQMRTAVKTMALAIDQQVTPDQRHHAMTKLQRLIDQLHDLQAE